jgi:hypothetical protein
MAKTKITRIVECGAAQHRRRESDSEAHVDSNDDQGGGGGVSPVQRGGSTSHTLVSSHDLLQKGVKGLVAEAGPQKEGHAPAPVPRFLCKLAQVPSFNNPCASFHIPRAKKCTSRRSRGGARLPRPPPIDKHAACLKIRKEKDEFIVSKINITKAVFMALLKFSSEAASEKETILSVCEEQPFSDGHIFQVNDFAALCQVLMRSYAALHKCPSRMKDDEASILEFLEQNVEATRAGYRAVSGRTCKAWLSLKASIGRAGVRPLCLAVKNALATKRNKKKIAGQCAKKHDEGEENEHEDGDDDDAHDLDDDDDEQQEGEEEDGGDYEEDEDREGDTDAQYLDDFLSRLKTCEERASHTGSRSIKGETRKRKRYRNPPRRGLEWYAIDKWFISNFVVRKNAPPASAAASSSQPQAAAAPSTSPAAHLVAVTFRDWGSTEAHLLSRPKQEQGIPSSSRLSQQCMISSGQVDPLGLWHDGAPEMAKVADALDDVGMLRSASLVSDIRTSMIADARRKVIKYYCTPFDQAVAGAVNSIVSAMEAGRT